MIQPTFGHFLRLTKIFPSVVQKFCLVLNVTQERDMSVKATSVKATFHVVFFEIPALFAHYALHTPGDQTLRNEK